MQTRSHAIQPTKQIGLLQVAIAALLAFLCVAAFVPQQAFALVSKTTLTFNANGGSFDNGATVYNFGTVSSSGSTDQAKNALTTMQGKVSRPDWTFAGWYSAASGGTLLTAKSDVMTKTTRTVYAQWKADSFTLTFDLNGGAIDNGIALTYANVETNTSLANAPKPQVAPRRDGYAFVGWGASETVGASAYSDGAALAPKNGKDQLTLYAVWAPETYSATFSAEGGAFASGEPAVTASNLRVGSSLGEAFPTAAPTRPGYSFNGWWTAKADGAGVAKDTVPTFASNEPNTRTYYAQWRGEPVSVVFDANGGAVGDDEKVSREVTCGSAIGALPENPARDKYDFVGWFDAETGGNKITSTTVCEKPGTVYYAHWEHSDCVVAICYPGSYDKYDFQTVKYGGFAVKPSDDLYGKTGEKKIATSWHILGEEASVFDFSTPITESIAIEPSCRGYRVKLHFDANGGTGTMGDVWYELGSGDGLPSCKFKNEGYTFTRWSTEDYDNPEYYWNDLVDNDGDEITLYAEWELAEEDEDYDDDYDDYDDEDEYTWQNEFSHLTARAPAYGSQYVSGGIYSYGEWGPMNEDSYSLINGARVSVKAGGKTYKGKLNKHGKFKIKAPALANVKIGGKVKVSFSIRGKKRTVTKKVKSCSVDISAGTIYRSDKSKTFVVEDLHKGDIVKVKAGKKTFKKTLKKSTAKLKWKVKINKPKEGSKLTVTVTNKFKQRLGSKAFKVYYGKKVKNGMTKEQVKLVPGYEHPDGYSKGGTYTYYSYSWDGGYEAVYFKNNRVYETYLNTW